jgi:microcystin-dependent protein
MAEPFLGEIHIMAFNFAPRNWALCNGQLLSINQNAALFALLGTQYGGNGTTNFALPNLQGRVPIHVSGSFPQGSTGGETAHTLTAGELPAHTHPMFGVTSPSANQRSLAGNMPGAPGTNLYNASANGNLASSALTTGALGSQPHNNLQPYLTLNFCIALAGIFPSRN